MAWRGKAWAFGLTWLGVARQGMAWLGRAGQGRAWAFGLKHELGWAKCPAKTCMNRFFGD